MPGCDLIPGFALDLTCLDPDDGMPWDFDVPAKRDKALHKVRTERPAMIIGSVMCTAWCSWQALNNTKRDPEVVRREVIRARMHLDFMVSIYIEQIEGGRLFLHEHPANATSWHEASVERLAKFPGVELVHADQCQYGAEVMFGQYKGQPIKKPTGFMSNGSRVLKALTQRCGSRDGQCTRKKGGKHAICSGKIAKDAARYPPGLVKAIIRGIRDELHVRGVMKRGEFGLHAIDDDVMIEAELRGPAQGYSGKYVDDMSKQVLKDSMVQEARAKELLYFNSKGVWRKRPRSEAFQKTGRPPITVRWVDINKGDGLNLSTGPGW